MSLELSPQSHANVALILSPSDAMHISREFPCRSYMSSSSDDEVHHPERQC